MERSDKMTEKANNIFTKGFMKDTFSLSCKELSTKEHGKGKFCPLKNFNKDNGVGGPRKETHFLLDSVEIMRCSIFCLVKCDEMALQLHFLY